MNRTMKLAAMVMRRIEGLARDERGVSAVEFAMLLPLMLTLYLGTVEISQGIAADRKVTWTARTVADLVSQVSSVSSTEIANSLNASAAVMVPFPASNLRVTVSSITIDASSNAKVAWSCTLNGTVRPVGSSVSLPAALVVPNTSLIWGEVGYMYKPVIGYVVTGTLNLKDEIFMRPRLSNSVTGPSSC